MCVHADTPVLGSRRGREQVVAMPKDRRFLSGTPAATKLLTNPGMERQGSEGGAGVAATGYVAVESGIRPSKEQAAGRFRSFRWTEKTRDVSARILRGSCCGGNTNGRIVAPFVGEINGVLGGERGLLIWVRFVGFATSFLAPKLGLAVFGEPGDWNVVRRVMARRDTLTCPKFVARA